jgi:hypothetical protein
MRILVLSGLLFWLVHDRITQSPLLIADLLSLAMGAVVLLRQWAHSTGQTAVHFVAFKFVSQLFGLTQLLAAVGTSGGPRAEHRRGPTQAATAAPASSSWESA